MIFPESAGGKRGRLQHKWTRTKKGKGVGVRWRKVLIGWFLSLFGEERDSGLWRAGTKYLCGRHVADDEGDGPERGFHSEGPFVGGENALWVKAALG